MIATRGTGRSTVPRGRTLPTFWMLQLLGWTGYFVAMAFSRIGRFPVVHARRKAVAHAARRRDLARAARHVATHARRSAIHDARGVGLSLSRPHVLFRLENERERALRAETMVAEVKLRALQQRLNPHLFFNTLSAISAPVRSAVALGV